MNRTKKVCQRAVVKWKPLMGLGHWRVNSTFYRKPGEVPKKYRPKGDYPGAAMWVRVDWEYLEAKINVNLPSMIASHESDEDIERTIMHELAHVVVNEMREWATHPTSPDSDQAMKHEERVVSTLAAAFMWTHSAGWNEGKADLRKKQGV